MTSLKIQHLPTLSFLLSKGAGDGFVPVTTTSVGERISKSQQAVSKHLMELERCGLVDRMKSGRRICVRITPEGYSQLLAISEMLQAGLNASPAEVELEGLLVSGMSEGAYYMSRDGYSRQFAEKIGYVPFPGTLNVRLEEKRHVESVLQVDSMEGITVDGFHDGVRAYGWVRCFGGVVNGEIPCHLIRLERTHHEPSIIEIISEVNIREAAGLSDGSRVSISIHSQREAAAPGARGVRTPAQR